MQLGIKSTDQFFILFFDGFTCLNKTKFTRNEHEKKNILHFVKGKK